jgi:hypothetical protein
MTNCRKCGIEIFWNEKCKSKYRHWIPLEKTPSGELRTHSCPNGNRFSRRAYDRRRQFYNLWL